MNVSTLLLFTYTFPYGEGEQFLEQEIPYLASAFRRVVIVPSRCDGVVRSLPDGVEVNSAFALAQRRRLRYVAGAMAASLSSLWLYHEFAANPHMLLSMRTLRRAVGYLGWMLSLARWLRTFLHREQLDPAAMLCYTYWLGWQAAAAGLIKARYPQLRLVSRAHGADLYAERQQPPYQPFRAQTLGRLDRLFLISEHGHRYMIERYPWVASRCEVARLGVDDPGFDAEPSHDGVLRVVSCSFMVPVKRLDLLIAGLRAFAALYPNRRVEWRHLGEGPLRGTLEEAARQLPAMVEWYFHGQLPNREVITFYHHHPIDVFANVSSSEGIPVSIMEAQSCSIPVVATAVGGTPEIVDSTNGVLLPPNPSPHEIAQALAQASAAGASPRQASRTSWKLRYNAEVNYQAFVHRLTEVENER